MNHGVNGILLKNGLGSGGIAEVHHLEGEVFTAGDLLHTFVAGAVAVGKVVGHYDVVARLNQFHGHVTADKTGATGY